MAIPEIILREIIDASAPENNDLPRSLPCVKVKYLMVGMSIDLGEYFTRLKHDIETTFAVPTLIDDTPFQQIVDITTDEWLHVTGVIADNDNKTITVHTDDQSVPPVRLPEDMCVMVLVGDDASKSNYTAPTPQTFAEYIDEMRGYKHYNGTTLYGFIRDVTDPDKESFMQNVQSWDELRDWLIAHNAPEDVRIAAESAWNRYEKML